MPIVLQACQNNILDLFPVHQRSLVHLLCFNGHWTVGTKYGHMYLFIPGQLIVNVSMNLSMKIIVK